MMDKSLPLPHGARPQERSSNPKGRLSERREKGLWSFLTWSFFLSQVVGAEQASAAATRPSGSADDTTSTSDAAVSQAATNAVRPLTAETQEAAADASVQNLAQAAAPSVFLAAAPAELTLPEVRSIDESSTVRLTSAAPESPVGNQPAANSAPAVIPHPELGSDAPGVGDLSLPTIEIPPVVGQVIAPVMDLVGEVVDDIGDVLDSVVDQVVAPVISIVGDVIQVLDPVVDHMVAPVIGIVGDMVQVLDPVVDHMLAPVIGIVGDVVGDVVQVLDPVVEQVIAPVVQALDPVVAPVAEVLEPLLAPVADIVGGPLASLLGLGPGGGTPIIMTPVVAASSSSMDFEGAPAAGSLPLDDLFSGGGYTDYNLALRGDVPAGANSAPGAILHDVADAAGDILGAVTGSTSSDGGHGGHASTHHIGLPSILGDLGLHGLGL